MGAMAATLTSLVTHFGYEKFAAAQSALRAVDVKTEVAPSLDIERVEIFDRTKYAHVFALICGGDAGKYFVNWQCPLPRHCLSGVKNANVCPFAIFGPLNDRRILVKASIGDAPTGPESRCLANVLGKNFLMLVMSLLTTTI